MRHFFLIWSLVLCVFQVNAQKAMPKISIADLEQKKYPADTTAAAAILYNKAKTTFKYDNTKGFTAIHEYKMRIKIYKPEGLKWANFEVPYYVGYENILDDRIKFSDGVTYNLENGQIVKTRLNSEGTFKKDLNEYWNMASITMPNVRAGSIIEFHYTLKSNDLGEFPVFNFQYAIPVGYAEYITEIPEFYIYKPVLIGYGEIKSEGKIERVHFTFDNKYHQTTSLDCQSVNSSYTGENIPALIYEPFVDNLSNYRSSVQHELERIRWPDEPEKNISTTWDGVAKVIFKDKRFGPEIEKRQYFEQDLPAIARSSATETEKANAIFEHVKRTMTWDNKYGYYTQKGVKKAYADKTGNAAEINFILISMLNHAGINANPVLVSTVENGIPAFPNLRVFNYVVAAAQIDGKQVLLDATDKYATLDILPSRALNWTGRLIRRDGSSQEINLVPSVVSRETVMVMGKIEATGKISGKVRTIKTDYTAYDFRHKLGTQDTQQYVEKLSDQLGEIEIQDYLPENKTDLAKPVTETFSFISNNHLEVIGDKLYLNPMLFFADRSNPFVFESRKLPMYFGYPKQTKYNINIEIPEGYVVESLPKPITISTGENIGNFNFNILQNANRIQITVTHETNAALVSAAFYEAVREFYRKIIEKEHEKIVLKKA
jgi:hypothetical protein